MQVASAFDTASPTAAIRRSAAVKIRRAKDSRSSVASSSAALCRGWPARAHRQKFSGSGPSPGHRSHESSRLEGCRPAVPRMRGSEATPVNELAWRAGPQLLWCGSTLRVRTKCGRRRRRALPQPLLRHRVAAPFGAGSSRRTACTQTRPPLRTGLSRVAVGQLLHHFSQHKCDDSTDIRRPQEASQHRDLGQGQCCPFQPGPPSTCGHRPFSASST